MKQLMVRLAAALSVVAIMGLTGTVALAQQPAGGMPQGGMSQADQKEMMEFQKKFLAIQKKYGPQLKAIETKYKPETEAIEKKFGLTKYKTEGLALQTQMRALKPEDQRGPKGQSLLKKLNDLQTKAKSDPNFKKAQEAGKPLQKKMFAEMKPLIKRFGDEILSAAPAKLKPGIQQQLNAQLKQMGG